MRKVAAIGAGPGGLVAARYLKSEGFNPVVHEQGARVGGQWSADPYHSGVWPAMRTNTSRIMTSFSDLPHYAGCPTYPTNEEMGEYLQRYAETSDLVPHIRLNSPVRELRRDTPMSFRMSGRDSLPDAPQRFAEDVQAFGCIPSNEFAPAQIIQLQALAAARKRRSIQSLRRYHLLGQCIVANNIVRKINDLTAPHISRPLRNILEKTSPPAARNSSAALPADRKRLI